MLKERRFSGEDLGVRDWLDILSSPEGKKLRPIVVLDIDDTIFECMLKHYSVWEEWINEKKWGENTPELIALTDFIKSGGSKSYLAHFIDNPDLSETDFYLANSANVLDPEFNRDMQLVPSAKEILDSFSELVAFYLTARPENMKEVTIEELRKNSFPNPDKVICAPEPGHYSQPADFKIAELKRIQQETGQLVILIDDSSLTCKAVEDLGDPQIQAFRINVYAEHYQDEIDEQKTWSMASDFIEYHLKMAAMELI